MMSSEHYFLYQAVHASNYPAEQKGSRTSAGGTGQRQFARCK